MDRKSAYKAKSTAGALDRATRQLRADDKRKRDRADLLMTKRGLSDLTNQKTQREKEKPITLKETDASKKRREELDKWLKKKEEQKKKEALGQKKPFYAGSAQVMSIGKFGYSVKPHACAHGSKASRGGGGGGETIASAPQQPENTTRNKNKSSTSGPLNRRPMTRAQTMANGKSKQTAPTSQPGPSSKPGSTASTRTTRSSQPRTAANSATVVKGKGPARKATLQQTVTKATEKQEPGLCKKRQQKGTNASRIDASNISSADLPWVSGATLPLDRSTLPPTNFKGAFCKEFNSPFQFGRRSSGRGCTRSKKTVEAAGFQFTFEAKAIFNKDRAPYNPSESLVTVMRGEPNTESPGREFSYVPAEDLLTSPELSSASSQEKDFVMRVKEEEEGPCVTAACSTRKALFNDTIISKTPHIQFTCVVTPSKSVGRYSTRSNLEMSHKAERLRRPSQQHTVEKESEGVVQKAIFDDSLEGSEAVDDNSAHSARLYEFHDLHRREVSRLEGKCSVWEGKMDQLQQRAEQEEEEEDSARYEEAVDLVRMTVCMTRLLVKEKLKQFSDLCFRAENVRAVQPVKLDDLQAFWDMVHLQVEALDSKFAHLEKLEQNNWCPVVMEKKGRKGRKKAAPKARKSASSVAVSSDSSSEKSGSEAGKKRESARLKLREMKEAAKRAKSSRGEGADMEDVMVMFPGMKVADSKEGDVFKAPPSVSLSANGGIAGTMQAKTPLQAGQQKARTRGSSLRRSTRQSKTIDPAEFGYNFSEFIGSMQLGLAQPKQEQLQTSFIQTTCQPIGDAGSKGVDGDSCEVPENADLTFYTTHPSTPPVMEDVACALLGEGGANDSLDFLKHSEEKGTESAPSCPVGNLIVFTPTPKTNRRKSRSGPAAVSRRRGSIKMYSQISPRGYLLRGKNHIFEQGVDMLMSPVRRSSRILVTPNTSARKISRMEVINLDDLPGNQRVGVVPNSNLLLS